MSEELTAASVTAGSLLSRFRFMIPQFQREYAWTQEEVSEFFRDLQQSLDRDFYFLGLVVLTGTGKRREVVDGQQRLLTLSLLAAALRDEATRRGRRATAAQISSTFLSALDYTSDEQVSRVVLASAQDAAALEQLLRPDPPTDADSATVAEPGIRSLLFSSAAYLRRQLGSDLSNSADELQRIGTWANFLTNSIQFALFDHPDPASAYRVFEVMNTRGRGLTPTDLLKSYVLSAVDERERDTTYERWSSLVGRFAAIEQTSQVNQFIRHVVTVSSGYVAPKDLYEGVTRRYPDRASILDLLDTLEQTMPVYLQMIDPSVSGPAHEHELRAYEAMNHLNVIVARPLLLAIHAVATEVTDAVEALIRLIVPRMVTGYLGTGAVERRISTAASRIHEEGDWRGPIVSLQDLAPDSETFEQQAATRQLNQRVLHFLLASIDNDSAMPTSEVLAHLHFIRPRAASEWTEFPDEDFTRWGSTLGNAVLASQERRPRGASTWEGFCAELLPLVPQHQQAELAGLDTWSTRDVQERGRRLARRAADVWYGA